MKRIKPGIVLSLLAVPVVLPATASAVDPVLDVEERAFCKSINQYRAQNGRPALRVSVSLTNASKWMSGDMAAKNYFSHTDSLGRSFGSRQSAFGYRFSTSKAENIAAGSATAGATFTQWRTSPGHNVNMLNSAYKVIGIGRAFRATSTFKWYWTTDFGGQADRTIPC